MDGVRRLVIALLCLAGVAVIVDFGAAAYAEYRVSRALRVGADLSADPAVIFHGFPFLTQAARGDYRDVEIRAQGRGPDATGETFVEASLEGVTIPPSSLIDGDVGAVPVERLSGRMRIEATELGQLLGIPDLQISAPPADKSDGTGGSGGSGRTTNGATVLTGTVPVNGEPTEVSVRADLLVEGNQVRLVATDYYYGPDDNRTDLLGLEVARPAVLQQFSRVLDTRQLPFGVVPTRVAAEGSQIVIEGTGEHITIDLDRLQKP
jgi:LmeA-like phospholipid-binding